MARKVEGTIKIKSKRFYLNSSDFSSQELFIKEAQEEIPSFHDVL